MVKSFLLEILKSCPKALQNTLLKIFRPLPLNMFTLCKNGTVTCNYGDLTWV